MNRTGTSRLRTPLIAALIIVVGVLVLGATLYAGDRFGHRRAEQRVADTLQPQLGTPQPPQVNIEGFPFLTQVVSGSIGEMQVRADQLGETTQSPLIVAHADLVMTDVATIDWFKTMTIAHTEGVARIDYAKLSAVAGAPLTYGGEGRLELVVKTTVFRREVEAVISGTPRLNAREQTMTLSDAKISVEGVNLPDFTAQTLLAALLRPIPLKGMPLGLTITKIVASEDGMHVDLVGDNLKVPA